MNEMKIQQRDIDAKRGFYISVCLSGSRAQTAGEYGAFFIARNPIEIMRASEVHAVAGSDGGAVTLDIEKLSGTTALGSGTSILASTFDLKGTANTVVDKEGVNLSSARIIKEGERLALVYTGTLTSLSDVCVTLYCKFLGNGNYK